METILVFSFKFFKCQQKLFQNTFTCLNDETICKNIGNLLLTTSEMHKLKLATAKAGQHYVALLQQLHTCKRKRKGGGVIPEWGGGGYLRTKLVGFKHLNFLNYF
uniref:Uncharacterized protein n=1 Tax=Meloidogyne enterolobii TaxID=390850 RepID=A0A6V7VJ79_MELEN|nr:unnamed protein product [Meloidogyne enterolobii]